MSHCHSIKGNLLVQLVNILAFVV